ncbi:LacI family DNA-binding transcriptional regulator [Pectinatus haikarae]|uniref:LacI family DNA-binding transcriptional regulator n=1 Tax=Pectinatus haikarae TaxID=349096 RepID=UPI0018C49D89
MADITIKDIADKLGVSPATVSLALNDRPGVNAQTRKRVLDIVKKLNYTGTGFSRTRKGQKNNDILNFLVYKRSGKVIADTQFFTTLIESVERAARACDYTITLTYCENETQFLENIGNVLATSAAGLIVLGTEMQEKDVRLFEGLDIPIVILDNELLGMSVDTVMIHNMKGICEAVNYLYSEGHTTIGYLKSSFSIRNFEYRFLSYKYALDHLGLEYSSQYTFSLDPSMDGAFEDMNTLLAKSPQLPTAFMADNDLIAVGALKALRQNGVRIPEDVSVIGFDDIPMCTFIEPELASISVPIEQLGTIAVRRLMEKINNSGADSSFLRIAVETSFIARGSAGSNAAGAISTVK